MGAGVRFSDGKHGKVGTTVEGTRCDEPFAMQRGAQMSARKLHIATQNQIAARAFQTNCADKKIGDRRLRVALGELKQDQHEIPDPTQAMGRNKPAGVGRTDNAVSRHSRRLLPNPNYCRLRQGGLTREHLRIGLKRIEAHFAVPVKSRFGMAANCLCIYGTGIWFRQMRMNAFDKFNIDGVILACKPLYQILGP